MKKYRINESEHFNLLSMYEHLKYLEIDMEESNTYDKELEKRIEEVESLLNKAPYISASRLGNIKKNKRNQERKTIY